MLEKIVKFVKENKSLILASAVMVGVGIADATFTLGNLKDGTNYEGNFLYRVPFEYYGVAGSLYGMKIGSSILAIGAAKELKDIKYDKLRGETLLYGGALYWSVGAITNLFYYITS